MDVLCRLDQARRATNVLEHPFYERWSAGELSADELSRYAGEYRYAVLALAHASALLAAEAVPEHRAGLERHAQEEAAHVALWDQFARATRAVAGHDERGEREPAAQTRACAAAWTAGEDALEHLAERMVTRAQAALRGNWELLSGVEAASRVAAEA